MAPAVRRVRKHDVCVFIGRFQPLHAGHLAVIEQALLNADFVIIVVGSAFQPRRPDQNPFFFEERRQMLLADLPREVRDRILIVPIPDSNYDKNAWAADVYKAVTQATRQISDKKLNVSLIGHSKDHTSYYLSMFPQWDSINVPLGRDVHATRIRDDFLSRDDDVVEGMFKRAIDLNELGIGTINWLREFQKTEAYAEQVDEREFYRACHAKWASESWPNSRNTVTATALIHQAGHVLIGQRGEYPQKGSWALLGGHLNTDETVYECGLREAYEESGIAVPKIVFERSLVAQDFFDAPFRDPRGRYIDHVFMFDLNPQAPKYDPRMSADENRSRIQSALDLPKVKGADDMAHVEWKHLSEIDSMRNKMFLDHYAIIKKMTAMLPKEKKEAA